MWNRCQFSGLQRLQHFKVFAARGLTSAGSEFELRSRGYYISANMPGYNKQIIWVIESMVCVGTRFSALGSHPRLSTQDRRCNTWSRSSIASPSGCMQQCKCLAFLAQVRWRSLHSQSTLLRRQGMTLFPFQHVPCAYCVHLSCLTAIYCAIYCRHFLKAFNQRHNSQDTPKSELSHSEFCQRQDETGKLLPLYY